jgi:uncharacterized protein HemY
MEMKTTQLQMAFNTFLILWAVDMDITLLVLWIVFNVPYMCREVVEWKTRSNTINS